MAHGTRINGTAYGVTGGKCLVGGTAYSIKKGRTLIGGTGYDINLNSYDPVLNNNTWEQIAEASINGVAESVWNVGDTKEIILSGSIVTGGGWYPTEVDLSGTYLCYILGFNHNGAFEGANRIHFQLSRSLEGVELCYGEFAFNDGSGLTWSSSDIRNNILGIDPQNCEGTFLGSLPTDLLEVLRPAQKSTYGQGRKFTITSDYIWLPSDAEIYGGQYASENQMQYDYYASGGSKKRYSHERPSRSSEWWLRNAGTRGVNVDSIAYVDKQGNRQLTFSDEELSIAPIFCV